MHGFKFLIVQCKCTLHEYEAELVGLGSERQECDLSRIGKKWEICVVELAFSFLLSFLCGLYLNENVCTHLLGCYKEEVKFVAVLILYVQ
jgi:hypothetical protein